MDKSNDKNSNAITTVVFLEEEQECFNCHSRDIITSHITGDTTCTGCGMVLSERMIDNSPEWNCYFNDDKGDPTRNVRASTGPDEDSYEPMQSILVGGSKKDRDMLSRQHAKSVTGTQKSVEREVCAGGDLQELAFRLGISDTVTVLGCFLYLSFLLYICI